jgi:hypothetical protein
MRRTNRAFYAHVAAVYFWWRSANGVAGYLEAEYAKLNRQFVSRVKYGVNFSPLLVLVWGNDNCATADLDRHSRALNSIDAEFNLSPSTTPRTESPRWRRSLNVITASMG